MLEKMRENQKTYYQNRRSSHTFKVGDLVLLRKHNVDKMELNGGQITGLLNSPQPGQLLRTNSVGKVKDATLVTLNLNAPLRIGNENPAQLEELANLLTILIIYLTLTSQWINLLIIRQALSTNIT